MTENSIIQDLTSVLLVSDDPRIRAEARTQLEARSRHVFTCTLDDLGQFCRNIRVDVVVALGQGPREMARLREGLAALEVRARRIVIVEHDEHTLLARLVDAAQGAGMTRKR